MEEKVKTTVPLSRHDSSITNDVTLNNNMTQHFYVGNSVNHESRTYCQVNPQILDEPDKSVGKSISQPAS